MLDIPPEARHRDTNGARLADPARRVLRLLVVDDHSAVRVGLKRLLDDEPDFEVVALRATGEGAATRAERDDIDVAIVDYHLDGRNGLWVSRTLKRLPRPPRVIIFSAFANDHLAANCIVAGADALLSKGSLGYALCDTIRSVARSGPLPTTIPHPMADMLSQRLTGIDQRIFGMLLAGIPGVEIEQTLHISVGELEFHRASILNELERLPGERAEVASRQINPYRRAALHPSPRPQRPSLPPGPPRGLSASQPHRARASQARSARR